MNFLEEMLALLPAPYSAAQDSVLAQCLNALALEMEAIQEDIERMRLAHWVNAAYRLEDLEKIAALVGIARLPWETLPFFRARLLALVKARLAGALGPLEIRRFVVDYLRRAEENLASTFVPGLRRFHDEAAFKAQQEFPHYRPPVLAENPEKLRVSSTLQAIGGRVPYLYRWEEKNTGVDETVAAFAITGFPEGRTAIPILVNLTTGELIGFRGVVPLGRTLELSVAAHPTTPRQATATIDGRDVTAALFSVSSFVPGVPFAPGDHDPQPRLPRMVRGVNRWVYISVGLYDVRGLNHYFFAIADDQLREGVYNETFFNHALFPSGPVARLAMEWVETEPASFEVRVPRYLVIEPAGLGTADTPPHELVAEALRLSIQQLHAAGVRAEVRFMPFVETQEQRVRVALPWVMTEPEFGPSGQQDRVSVGARYGESGLDDSRFE